MVEFVRCSHATAFHLVSRPNPNVAVDSSGSAVGWEETPEGKPVVLGTCPATAQPSSPTTLLRSLASSVANSPSYAWAVDRRINE